MHNSEVYPMGSMVLAMGFAYGGCAQILAGIFDYCRGNFFGMTVFCSYGFFWWSFSFTLMWPNIMSDKINKDGSRTSVSMAAGSTKIALAWYMFIWGLTTACFMCATFRRGDWVFIFLFFTVVVLFWLLAGHFWSDNGDLLQAAGIEGAICGSIAIYLAFAEILNSTYGRVIIWTGKRTFPPKQWAYKFLYSLHT